MTTPSSTNGSITTQVNGDIDDSDANMMARYNEVFRTTTEAFESRDDVVALSRISDTLAMIERRRNATLEAQRNVVENLNQQLLSLKKRVKEQEVEMNKSRPDETDLDENLDDDDEYLRKIESQVEAMINNTNSIKNRSSLLANLEKKKLDLAKKITQLETSNDTNAATLERLNRELEELLENDTVETSAGSLQESTVLKLKVLKELGVSVDGDGPETHTRVLIHPSNSSNVHSLNLGSYSSYFISNYIWEKL